MRQRERERSFRSKGGREGESGVSFCGCLTTMGEQSDARFRWQEIELHEHAKLHHFGTTVNNFPFTWRRRSIFRDALRAVGLCGGKTWRGRCRGGGCKNKI